MTHNRDGGSRRGGAGRCAPSPASGGRGDELRVLRNRTQIAQTAARLIAEHGITDWSLAKRKALRQLMLPAASALPSNEDVEQALVDHHALFGGDAHAASLRQQRAVALAWMQRLERYEPVLVGGVAAGWATAYSDVRLELVADDPKAVELLLVSAGVGYVAAAPSDGADRPSGATELRIATRDAAIRLAILTPAQRRNRPRRDDGPRLTATDVKALLA